MSDEMKPWESLGFDSFDAMIGDQKAKLDQLQRRLEEKDKMIDRQSQEVGDARKRVQEMEESIKEVTSLKERLAKLEDSAKVSSEGGTAGQSQDAPPADTLDKLSESELESRFTDEQAEEFERFFSNLPPENQKIVNSSTEARAEAMRTFLRTQARQQGFFKSRQKKIMAEKDVMAQIREMFSLADKGTRAPASVTPNGPPPRERLAQAQEEQSRTIPKVTAQSGSIIEGIRNARV